MPNLGRREFLFTAAGSLAWAQDARFSSRVDVVNFPVSVRDKQDEIDGASSEKPGQRFAQFDGTALYDAVQVPVDTIMKMRQGRKALILLSDGVDTVSNTSLWRAIEGAQRADTLIYSLCYADPDSDRRDQARGAGVLRALAEQTGGRYFKVSREQSLDEVYSLIQDELRNQYNLGYIPASDGPAYRKIRVSVNRKGLTVQSRDGYYSGA